MKTTFFKKHLAVLSSIGLIFLFWSINIFCTFYPDREAYRAKLFSPKTISQPENEPFYYYDLPSYMVSNGFLLQKAGIDENIAEWVSYLKNTKESVIRQALYDGYANLDALYEGTATTESILKDNEEFASIYKENPAACEYMLFAKEAEHFLVPITVEGYAWDETPKEKAVVSSEVLAQQKKLSELFQRAKARYGKTKDNFLKMRYAYQMVTLRRYMTGEKEQKCSVLYDKYIAPLSQKSVLKYWAMLHKAHDLNGPEADYYYAMVFDNCAAKRSRAEQLYSRSAVDSVLMFAKNNQEWASIYFIDALNDGKVLENIKKVYQFAPQSKNLELLLTNEISKVEDWVLTEQFNNFRRDGYDEEKGISIDTKQLREEDMAYLKSLQTWVQSVVAENKIATPALWHLANAHLFYINKEWQKAQAELAIAEKAKGLNDNIRKQISTTRLLSFALDNGKITPAVEQKMYKDLLAIQRFELPESRKEQWAEANRAEDARSTLDNITVALANRYEQQGDVVKAGLLLSRSNNLMRSSQKFTGWMGLYNEYFFYFDEKANAADMKRVIDLVNNENKTAFEYFLTEKVDKEYFRMCDLYGTILFRDGEEEKALKAWSEVPESYWQNGGFDYKTYLNENPFQRSFGNPHDVEKGFFSKPMIVAKILEYKELAAKNNAESARYNYLIATAYFNVSKHGTAWMCSRYGWSNFEYLATEKNQQRRDDDNYLLLKNATTYYQKAAESSTDKGFAAFCYRLLKHADELKEELVYESTLTEEQKWDDTKIKPAYVSPFLTKMKMDYAAFYDDLINDCGKFYDYEKRGAK
jgi:hypothetical protein